jgi:hypothetical protein
MAIEHITLTYRVQVGYSYNTDDLPNLSMLTQRQLTENLESSLEFVRQTDALDHEDVTADWICDVKRMTVSS